VNLFEPRIEIIKSIALLQRVAVCCSEIVALHLPESHIQLLKYFAVCCSVLQCVAVCCSDSVALHLLE